ncbi:hypothetical protein RhiJN_06568 [Ceratobasidium sp. AG-Ba]|nr:hypothetical protein RhiJN_06568 [Ceratobasidium sp. AG-Ba]
MIVENQEESLRVGCDEYLAWGGQRLGSARWLARDTVDGPPSTTLQTRFNIHDNAASNTHPPVARLLPTRATALAHALQPLDRDTSPIPLKYKSTPGDAPFEPRPMAAAVRSTVQDMPLDIRNWHGPWAEMTKIGDGRHVFQGHTPSLTCGSIGPEEMPPETRRDHGTGKRRMWA